MKQLVLILVVVAATSSMVAPSTNRLMAQEAAFDNAVVVDGMMWSNESSAPVPWNQADEFCETLETEGFTDWRLPTLFELEALHDPEAHGGIRISFELEDCCAWSSMNLAELGAERKGNLPEQGGAPAEYYWGFLFAGGISYYSNGRFPDGLALCVREP